MRDDFFRKTTELPMSWHKDNHSGQIIDKINRASGSLREFSSHNFMYIETLIRYIGSVIALLLILSYFGLVTFVFTFIILSLIIIFDKYLFKNYRKINDGWHKVGAAFYDYIGNISTVITLRIEKLVKKEVIRRINKIFPIFKKSVLVSELKWFLVSLALTAMSTIMVIYYCYDEYTKSGVILVGTVVMLFRYLRKIEGSFYNLAWQYGQLVRAKSTILSVQDIEDAYDKLVKEHPVNKIDTNWEEINISNLSFRYEDREKSKGDNLKKINLKLLPKSKIALVGSSGSGKSTLMSILRGLYWPREVELKVNNKYYKDLSGVATLSTLIPQDPEIFENTIEYNVTAGVGANKKLVNKVIDIACFSDVVKRLPKGLETSINEKGVNLSGGEKQRLALARGLFASQDSDIILLDESTSSVDVHNETEIYRKLMKYYEDKCIIASIHKLHLINYFDYIYIVKDGEVIEKGIFDDLIANKGTFYDMWVKYQESLKQQK